MLRRVLWKHPDADHPDLLGEREAVVPHVAQHQATARDHALLDRDDLGPFVAGELRFPRLLVDVVEHRPAASARAVGVSPDGGGYDTTAAWPANEYTTLCVCRTTPVARSVTLRITLKTPRSRLMLSAVPASTNARSASMRQWPQA